MTIFRRDSLTEVSNVGGVGKNRDSRPIFGCRIDDWSASNSPPFRLAHRWRHISESLFMTACSMDDHNKEKRTEFKFMQR